MSTMFSQLIEQVLCEGSTLDRVWFARDCLTPPQFSYQVNFPRLELVMSGVYINQVEDKERGIIDISVVAGDAFYIPPNCWNKPDWSTDCSVLSLLFGRRQLGFSLVSKRAGDEGFYDVQKYSIQTRTGHAIDHILEALNALGHESNKSPMDRHLISALMSYSQSMIQDPNRSIKRHSEELYHGICIYIQENFHRQITRTTIANRFNISPNHLSRLFRQQGHMTLADYITWVRIDRAKFMLRRYELSLVDVATRCGFKDVNYFFRVFKRRTELTPTCYRDLGKAQSR